MACAAKVSKTKLAVTLPLIINSSVILTVFG